MKVLILVHSPTWFTELSILGRYIQTLPGHDVTFHILDYSHWTTPEFAASLRRAGIECTVENEGDLSPGSSGRRPQAAATPGVDRRISHRLGQIAKTLLRELTPAEVLDVGRQFSDLLGAIKEAQHLVRLHNPDVVVIGGNNPGYSTPALIHGFEKAGLPTVVVSSTMSNGLEEAAVFAGDARYYVTGWLARLVAILFPRWVTVHNGIRLMRCPVGRVVALEALRIAPPQPWVFNSGYAAALAMESQAMVEYYVKAGLPRDNMKLTGSPSDDVMAGVLSKARQLREGLYTELGLPAGRPMLLTALVPDFLYVTGGRPQCDFQKYYALVDFWIKSLADQETFNVVVALHPSVKPESMKYLERRNVRIASRKTSELVPLCDLYVASISSTIRWAIACGKPVINYDVYRYRYTDFLDVAGVAATEEQDEFRALIRKFSNDPAYLKHRTALQQAEAPRWGKLDGNSSQRIVRLLEAVAGSPAVHPVTLDRNAAA